MTFIQGGRLRIQSRNLQDITAQFPELAQLPKLVKADQTVIDGELVCFDREGRPSFSGMRQLVKRQAHGRAVRRPPVHFVAFDLLFLRGLPVIDQPLGQRKELLHEVLEPSELAQESEFIETDGTAFFQATCDLGLEGIMAKDKSSPYSPGKRGSAWLKVKRVRESEFVIGGYAFGGRMKEPFSALLLGLYDDDQQLAFAGHVGTGLAQGVARQI